MPTQDEMMQASAMAAGQPVRSTSTSLPPMATAQYEVASADPNYGKFMEIVSRPFGSASYAEVAWADSFRQQYPGQVEGFSGSSSSQAGRAQEYAGTATPSPTQLQTLPSNLPMANVYNQQVVALNAARQEGATTATVQNAVNTYNAQPSKSSPAAAQAQLAYMDPNLPAAGMYNLAVTAMNAARQEGATGSSVQQAVTNYNLYSAQNYNPVNPNGTINRMYVPEGNFIQQELSNVKIGVAFNEKGQSTGEYAIYKELPKGFNGETRYTVDPATGQLTNYMLIGGGGRNALQSGTVGFAAATPAVYAEGRVGQKEFTRAVVVAPGVATSGMSYEQVVSAVKAGTAGSLYSRLGSEAYGGIVTRLDARTLGDITYEDVSNRAAWNLASYVNPTDVNMSKADLPGVNIPWGVSSTAPAAFTLGTIGGVGAPVEIKSFTAYVGGESNAPKSAATTLIIGGQEGTRYGPSIVTSDRLVGGGKVASVATTESTLPSPFVSGTIEKPTGEVFGYKIPIISDFIALTSPSVFVSGRASSVTTQTISEKTGGPDYATTSTRDLYTFSGVSQKSEYDQFLDANFRAYIPSKETGEAGLRIATIANPVTAPSVISSAILERVAPEQAAGAQYFEPLRGQYALFYERPEIAAVAYATGGVFGLGTRGLSAVASRSVTLSEAATTVSRIGGTALGAIYGGVVTYESTGGFREFGPENIAQIRARAVQEAYPMALGFERGYTIPESISAARADYITRTTTPYNRVQFMSNEDAVLGGGRPFRLESGRMSSYESLTTETPKYSPAVKLGDFTPLPKYAGEIKAPAIPESAPRATLIQEIAKPQPPAPVKTVRPIEYVEPAKSTPLPGVLTARVTNPAIPEIFTGRVEIVSSRATTAGRSASPSSGFSGSTPQVLITKTVATEPIATLDLTKATEVIQVGNARMAETVSKSSLRVMKSTEDSGALYGTGMRNIQRLAGRTAAKETLGQMKVQQQLPRSEGVAESQFETSATIGERTAISMRDALTRVSSVMDTVVRQDVSRMSMDAALRASYPISETVVGQAVRPAMLITTKTGLASMEEAKSVIRIAPEEIGVSKKVEPSVSIKTPSIFERIEPTSEKRVVPDVISPLRAPGPEEVRPVDATRTPEIPGVPDVTKPSRPYVPTPDLPKPPETPKPPEPPVPIIPKPPGVPWLGSGGGGGGGYKKPYRNLKTEIFTYAPKNLNAIFGRRKSRRK